MLLHKKSKIVLFTVLLASTALITNSCGIGFLVRGVVKNSLKTENNSLPEELDLKNQTILVMMWNSGSYDKYAQKAFQKKYGGKCEFIGFEELKKEKYANMDKYRYAFSQGPGDSKLYTEDSFSYSFTGSRPFHIYDRQKNSFYNLRVRSGMYYRVMQAYAMRLEQIRTGKKPL